MWRLRMNLEATVVFDLGVDVAWLSVEAYTATEAGKVRRQNWV